MIEKDGKVYRGLQEQVQYLTDKMNDKTLPITAGEGITVTETATDKQISNAGVLSLNGLKGAVTISQGTGISFTPTTNGIRISASGGSSAVHQTNGFYSISGEITSNPIIGQTYTYVNDNVDYPSGLSYYNGQMMLDVNKTLYVATSINTCRCIAILQSNLNINQSNGFYKYNGIFTMGSPTVGTEYTFSVSSLEIPTTCTLMIGDMLLDNSGNIYVVSSTSQNKCICKYVRPSSGGGGGALYNHFIHLQATSGATQSLESIDAYVNVISSSSTAYNNLSIGGVYFYNNAFGTCTDRGGTSYQILALGQNLVSTEYYGDQTHQHYTLLSTDGLGNVSVMEEHYSGSISNIVSDTVTAL